MLTSASNPDDIETVSEGTFRYRARKGAPIQALRIVSIDGLWVVYLNGREIKHCRRRLAKDIDFLLHNAPFWPITQAEYDSLIRAHEAAEAGNPLATPDAAVDMRAAPALYRGKRP